MERKLKSKLSVCGIAMGLLATVAHADSVQEAAGWSGTVGVGPMVYPKYSGGKDSQARLLPLISANYNGIIYIEPLRAGMFLAASDDRKMGFGLAVEPRTGFRATDGARLAGMTTRRNSLEGGFSFDWDLDVVQLDISYFGDLTHSSRGTSSRIYLYKDLVQSDVLKFGAFVGAERLSAKVSNYFFGVTPGEATASRPVFLPGSVINVSIGFDGSRKLSRRYSFVFGFQATRLASDVAHSPIVETSKTYVGWAGLAWNL